MAKGKTSSLLQPVLFAAAGVVAARMANKITFIAENPTIGGAVKTGLGLFLAMQKSKSISMVGLGMAAVGATELVTNFLPAGTLGGVGYLPNASTYMPGVAGVPPIIVD
jgi:hypothetical protein